MNWNKAVKQIEQALTADVAVSVRYHRKWMKNDCHFDKIDSVTEYEYKGQICKAVTTYHDQINEGSHIIDEVIIER